MEIRTYRESDEERVVRLWREVFPDAPAWNEPTSVIAHKLKVQRELFFVAVDGDEIVGTTVGGYDGFRGWVYAVAVSPRHRRKGIGTALMRSVEDGLKDMGCPKLNLQVRGTNRAAAGFYDRLGYSVEDRVSMGKRLTEIKKGHGE